MAMENDVTDLLVNDTTFAALVGSDDDSNVKIYPAMAVAGDTEPYCVFLRESTEHMEYMLGAVGVAFGIYSIETHSGNYVEIMAIAEAIRAKLQGYHGTQGDTTIQGIFLQNTGHTFTPPSDGSDEGTYQIVQDFKVAYED
jgi:hypothetical protein